MKPILLYDTETNGIPLWDKPSDDPAQPRVTQLAALLVDESTERDIASLNLLIRPDGWTIPPDLEKLTGITTDDCRDYGIPMQAALPMFMHLWERAWCRCAHNEQFDMRMVRIEIMRHPVLSAMGEGKYADQWKEGKAFCTQTQSTGILKLPPTAKMLAAGRNHAKSPNLGEAYRHFTGKPLEGAHNAMVDVQACKVVYFAIKKHQATTAQR